MAPKKSIEKKEKKAPGPYIKFCQKRRPEIKKVEPDIGFGDIAKKMGAEWKAMTDAQKAKFK